jgi:DNA-binding YbaB/EbfC family protein
MFKGISNLAQMMRHAGELQSRFGEMKARLAQVRGQGSAGAGLVVIEATGDMRITSCRIDASLLTDSDGEMLEELIVSAINQALERARQLAADQMQSATADIPGLSDLISRMGPQV